MVFNTWSCKYRSFTLQEYVLEVTSGIENMICPNYKVILTAATRITNQLA